MPLKILSNALVTGDFTYQKSTFTTITGEIQDTSLRFWFHGICWTKKSQFWYSF